MAVSPIAEAVALHRHRRAKIVADAEQAALTLRQDLGMPRGQRQWNDHPGKYNQVNSQAVMLLERNREQTVAQLRAARADTRKSLYRVRTGGPEGSTSRTMHLMDLRQAREYAMNLPLGEPGFHMAMERMRAAALVGDEPAMAALSLLAEERTDGQRGTAWDRIPAMWEQHTDNKFTRQWLADLREADDALDRLAAPERYSLPKLAPITPKPTPAPSLTTSNNQVATE